MSCALLSGYESLEKLKTSQPDLLFRDLHGLRRWLERSEAAAGDRPIATAGALIFNARDEALFLRSPKWSNLWSIPGGKIERGETAVAALEREIREETGLTLHDIRFVVVQDCIDSPEFYRPAHFLLFNYTARTTDTAVTLNEEADEFIWMAPAEALDRLSLNAPTRRLIELL
jgi:ADP-ribose pyrophosphatase YjhB (NUDIX family)